MLMDIPTWAWALGFMALMALYEHVSEKRSSSGKVKKSETDNSANLRAVIRPLSDTANPNPIVSNAWDGEITGKTITRGSSWDILRKKVIKRYNNRCTNCGRSSNLTVDHKVPLSLGGSNLMSNLTTLCKDCHEHKDQRRIFDKAFDAKDNYGEDHKVTNKVEILSKAINSGTRVKIAYTDYKGRKSERTISPKRLAKDKGRIYCISYCHLRQDGRTFRLSRIEI